MALSGTDLYSMITGIGDRFSKSYDAARQEAFEEQAPAVFDRLLSLQGGAAPASAPAPALGAPALSGDGATAPTGGPGLPFFARAQGSLPSEKLKGLIADVATRNDVSPDYLGRLVQIESKGDPNAYNKGSGASGLGQFIPSTAKAYGLTDPFDPGANLQATARLTLDNRDTLRQRLGRDPSPGELYLGHQQGAAGAARLLANPDVPAARIVGTRAVVSNGGSPDMSARDFARLWTSRFDDLTPQMAPAAQRAVAPQAIPAQVPRVAQTAAPITSPAFVPGALTMTMPGSDGASTMPAPALPAPAASSEEADKPVANAQPAQFVIPPGGPAAAPAAPVAAPSAAAPAAMSAPGTAAAAPMAAPAGFAGFGGRAASMSPDQLDALRAAWRNPVTRPMATQIYGEMLKGQASPWKLQQMGDQPVLFNERTAQIVPVGQAKRQTATVGNTVVDLSNGQPIYQGERDPKTATVGNTIVDLRTGQPLYQGADKPQTLSPGSSLVAPDGRIITTAPDKEKDDKFTYQSMPGVGMVALHPTDPDKSRVIIAGQQPRPLTADERSAYGLAPGQAAGMGADGKPFGIGGSTKTEVNVDTKGAGKFSEKANELQAKRYSDMVEAADNAVPLRSDIDAMANLAGQISTGKLAEARLSMAQYAKAAGLDSVAEGLTGGKMGEMEAFTALADKLTPRMRVPGSGSTSDSEGRAFRNSLPSLLKTPGGNAIIADTFRGLADYQAQAGDLAGKALRGEISQSEADQAIRALPSPYARLKEFRAEAGAAAAPGAASAPAASGGRRLASPPSLPVRVTPTMTPEIIMKRYPKGTRLILPDESEGMVP